MSDSDKYLEKLYYDITKPGSYGGIAPLLLHVNVLLRQAGKTPLHKRVVEEWLSKQPTYTLHRPARWKFTRNKIMSKGIDYQWQLDLVDMQSLSKDNKGYKHLLTCIDTFSRYAWVEPLKNKTGPMVTEAFKHIIDGGRKPEKVLTDMGKEFLNHHFKSLLKEHNIHFIESVSDKKASMVERFNRTLKEKMWRYFTHKNTHNYIDILPELVNNYNNSQHRILKMAPIKVSKRNERSLWKRLYEQNSEGRQPILKIGDTVRLSSAKSIFAKGYWGNWTDEEFEIVDVRQTPEGKPLYKVKDSSGVTIKGSFYEEELQKITVNPDRLFNIEKVLSEKKIKGIPHLLVKWEGLPASANQWIPKSDIVSV